MLVEQPYTIIASAMRLAYLTDAAYLGVPTEDFQRATFTAPTYPLRRLHPAQLASFSEACSPHAIVMPAIST